MNSLNQSVSKSRSRSRNRSRRSRSRSTSRRGRRRRRSRSPSRVQERVQEQIDDMFNSGGRGNAIDAGKQATGHKTSQHVPLLNTTTESRKNHAITNSLLESIQLNQGSSTSKAVRPVPLPSMVQTPDQGSKSRVPNEKDVPGREMERSTLGRSLCRNANRKTPASREGVELR